MPVIRLPRLHIARDTRGFTLIETLVAMVTGVAVTGALFAIMEFSLRETSREATTVQATQLARTTMNRIDAELDSACLTTGFTPVEPESTASKLVFVDAFSRETNITNPIKREIAFEKSELIEKTYPPATGSELANLKFESKANGEYHSGKLVERSREEGSGTEVPIFRYYKYSSTSNNGLEGKTAVGLNALKEMTTAEVASDPEAVSSVRVAFRTLPYNNSKEVESRSRADLSSQVTFAFSAPGTEASIEDKPCE